MPSKKQKMADSAELKHMVTSFRVSELQVLLGFAGRNKTGRKQELLQRGLSLLQRGCAMPVQIKIRELYSGMKPGRLKTISGQWDSPYSVEDYSDAKPVLRRRFPGKTTPPQASQSAAAVPPLMNNIDYSKKLSQPSTANQNSVPFHPDVRYKRLPFYDILGELLKPASLIPATTSRFQENCFVFHLTPQQAQDIAMSRDFRPGAKCEYTVQVQLRFCLLETSCEQDDNFPPSICIRVNGKIAPLPNPVPTTKPGVEPKRPGRPVDITSLCRLSPTMSNHVDVSWASEFNRGYCVAIFLVKRQSSDILLQRLKHFGNRHPDHSRALIKEKLSHDPDSEIATTSLRVSLLCPLGKMRMSIPIRASTCTHLQCFDASTFLMMNEKKPTWICPVCDKQAPFDKLTIDGLFVEIFRQVQTECSEIQFGEDGQWTPLKVNKETHIINSPPTPIIKPSATVSETKPAATSQKGQVIDLTLDSSDDDDDDITSPPTTSKGAVSPPVISIDTPPHPSTSHSPISNPSTPSNHLAHMSCRSPAPPPSSLTAQSRMPPLVPQTAAVSMTSAYNAPAAAHSSSSRTQTSGGSGSSNYSLNLEPINDQELNEFLNSMNSINMPLGNMPFPYQYPYFPSLSQSSSSHLPHNLSGFDSDSSISS